MPDSNKLPKACLECAGFGSARFHKDCHACRDMDFRESILCDLNRSVQETTDFQCHAYRPTLRLVGGFEKDMPGQDGGSRASPKRGAFTELFHSDKVKYERALALQKLSRDPDSVIVQLKYHCVWNVSLRTPVFVPANDFVSSVHDTFLGCSESAGGFVHILYLAPDHVHVYVESDGERSAQDMVHDIKKVSAKAIRGEFSSLQDILGDGVGLWDDAYFVETVG
jgi:REP element-mobilizing transposase RayT